MLDTQSGSLCHEIIPGALDKITFVRPTVKYDPRQAIDPARTQCSGTIFELHKMKILGFFFLILAQGTLGTQNPLKYFGLRSVSVCVGWPYHPFRAPLVSGYLPILAIWGFPVRMTHPASE